MTGINGILPVDKPQGFTSFDVVKKLRGMLKVKKIGHAGTLDPMATGVLPIFLGTATKACDILPVSDKRYVASFALGKESDTEDVWGDVKDVYLPPISREIAEKSLLTFQGSSLQIPPMYAAIRVNGKHLYELARKGIEVPREPRPIRIDTLRLLDFDEEKAKGRFEVSCSKGTYIRSLCRDFGKKLNTGAIMTGLRRTEAAGISCNTALTLEQIQTFLEQGTLDEHIIPIETVFQSYPSLRLSPVQSRMFFNGAPLDLKRINHPKGHTFYRVYDSEGTFFGLGEAKNDSLCVYKFFIERS